MATSKKPSKAFAYLYCPYAHYPHQVNIEWGTSRERLATVRKQRLGSGQRCGAIVAMSRPPKATVRKKVKK